MGLRNCELGTTSLLLLLTCNEFPAKSEEILISVSLSEATHFLGTLKFGIRICACPPLIVFLGSFDDDRRPSQSDCITIDYAIFFTHPPLPDVLAYARTSGT